MPIWKKWIMGRLTEYFGYINGEKKSNFSHIDPSLIDLVAINKARKKKKKVKIPFGAVDEDFTTNDWSIIPADYKKRMKYVFINTFDGLKVRYLKHNKEMVLVKMHEDNPTLLDTGSKFYSHKDFKKMHKFFKVQLYKKEKEKIVEEELIA